MCMLMCFSESQAHGRVANDSYFQPHSGSFLRDGVNKLDAVGQHLIKELVIRNMLS